MADADSVGVAHRLVYTFLIFASALARVHIMGALHGGAQWYVADAQHEAAAAVSARAASAPRQWASVRVEP